MIQVSKLLAQGAGLAPVLLKRAAAVTLDWDTRQKSRFQVTDSQGREVMNQQLKHNITEEEDGQ